jgi:hypothetical protein
MSVERVSPLSQSSDSYERTDVRTNEEVGSFQSDISPVRYAQEQGRDEKCGAARHGTSTAYRHHGCRCPDATESQRLAKVAFKKRRYLNGGPLLVDATGTIRRIQALRRLGWSPKALGRELGWSPQRVAQLGTQVGERVHVDVAARVDGLFERLSMTRGGSKIAE